MSVNKLWSMEQISEIENDLTALPPQQKMFTKREAIEHMKTAILKAKNNEQTIESVKDCFEKRGFKISQRELKEIFGVSVKSKKMATKKPPIPTQALGSTNAAVSMQV